MYTNREISWDEHLRWIAGLREDKANTAYIVHYEDEIVGSLSVNHMNFTHKTADWGMYLSPGVQGRGLASVLEFTLVDLVFNKLNFKKLNCAVLHFNKPVIRMHEKFGFIKEGEIRSEIENSNGRFNIVYLGMTKDEWDVIRPNKLYILERYNRPVTIEG